MTTEELIAARRAEPWREALRKSKKNKERADIPRVKMNELDPEYRSRTRLEEVNLGLTKEQAMQEAERCLDCWSIWQDLSCTVPLPLSPPTATVKPCSANMTMY